MFLNLRTTTSNLTVSIFSFLRSHTTLSLNPNPINPLTKTQLKTLVLNQYTHGKFSNLIQKVVASPSVLLTACQNLTSNGLNSPDSSLVDSVSKRFSVEEMGRELNENRFDVEACCVKMLPSRRKGESLILPNLKLKVVIEAVRMVLEVVYDDRFATFAYGGRVGMGRHTAIRYLKNSVENPNWWFSVVLNRKKFDFKHVDKLCLIIEEKIQDGFLIDFIRRLFECEALQIELGGCYLGRGFPQECGLSSILINIYFNGFDKEIQEMRLQIDRENPRLDSNEGVLGSRVFHKPIRIYAVRYLDEVLAVPPSVLHPPMSEKAIRARKKYLRQKEVRALELRNARERNRKKLGLKILGHVFKKLKQSDGFKSEFHIENEVRDIFRTWADEVVLEFFESLDERWNWHRNLSAGNFLSLRHIRDQLPQELVDAYDKFQDQVDKHLKPAKARKALEEEERRAEEGEQRKYAERTVEDLTKLCMKVAAPIELVRKAVKMAGFTNNMGRPRPIKLLIALEDTDIIKWYAGVGRRWLDFFCCCRNFTMVKTVVSYHLRFSCILTLAEKHESTKHEAIRHYTKDLKVSDMNGIEEVHFPTEREIKMMGDKNFSDPKPVDGAISLALIRLASDDSPYACSAHFCDRTDIILYRIRLLQNRLNVNPLDEKKWVPGMGAIHESLNRKCLPLCPDHINDLYMGKITLQDIDCTSFVDVD
ncbi:hypothetical protein L1049_007391 [Liquidambar formosana]|uniref:Domain X domain-containing protein n=1 Tax=Liquidambar formosana TaxID=63359 RepID=A0AAP0N9J4_LIQFO